LIEATSQTTSCTANLILCDTDLISDRDIAVLADEANDPSSIIVKIILDDIDDNLRVVKLETLPPVKSEVPSEFIVLEPLTVNDYSLFSTHLRENNYGSACR
jgi:hypothetical protein